MPIGMRRENSRPISMLLNQPGIFCWRYGMEASAAMLLRRSLIANDLSLRSEGVQGAVIACCCLITKNGRIWKKRLLSCTSLQRAVILTGLEKYISFGTCGIYSIGK